MGSLREWFELITRGDAVGPVAAGVAGASMRVLRRRATSPSITPPQTDVRTAGLWRSVLSLASLLGCWPWARLSPQSIDLSGYSHTAWRIRDGFTKGVI